DLRSLVCTMDSCKLLFLSRTVWTGYPGRPVPIRGGMGHGRARTAGSGRSGGVMGGGGPDRAEGAVGAWPGRNVRPCPWSMGVGEIGVNNAPYYLGWWPRIIERPA